VGFGSTTYSDGTATLWLRYVADGKPMYYTVTLVSTVPHYGGRRWWFICPIKKIRVAKLYLPPGATTSLTAPAGRAAGENDQKSFGVAWPSNLRACVRGYLCRVLKRGNAYGRRE
jgi:hypothetical protein